MPAKGYIKVEIDVCKGCGICVDTCPQKIIRQGVEVNSKGYPTIYVDRADLCTGCANCAIVCPDGAISVYRVKN